MKKHKGKLIICIVAMSLLLLPNVSFAATKTQSLTYTYHDSVIKSWTLGRIRATYTYSYNPTTKRLIDEKSINHSTSNIALGCSFSKVSKKWDWYNTKDANGTGSGTCSWRFGFGVDTSWIKIGNFKDAWMTFRPKGDGSWTSRFS